MKKLLSVCILFFLFSSVFAEKLPRNVIFLIGDGMGISQIYSGMVANNNKLALEQFTHVGFSKTYSSNKFTTDSGAGGTALACGVKTKNGMIGMTPDSLPAQSIIELASKNHMSTGIVVASSLTHATPASFIAHQVNRNRYEEIAADYLKTDIDVIIGGGRKYFEDRIDGRNLTDELKAKKYQIAYNIEEVRRVQSGKLAGLLYDDQNPPMPQRGTMLPDASTLAIQLLHNTKKRFFLMIEGSQLDWAGHENNTKQLVKEMLDFDQTIACALNFAKKDGNTLVIVTSDHETGGMSILNGKFGSDEMTAFYSTKDHSGIPVPVFAYGPGAEFFTGFMENTCFKARLEKLLRLKE